MPNLLCIGLVRITSAFVDLVLGEAAKEHLKVAGVRLKARKRRAAAAALSLCIGCVTARLAWECFERGVPAPEVRPAPSASAVVDPGKAPVAPVASVASVAPIPVNIDTGRLSVFYAPAPFPSESQTIAPEKTPTAKRAKSRTPRRRAPIREEPSPLSALAYDERGCSRGEAQACRNAGNLLLGGPAGICMDPALAYGEYEQACRELEDRDSCEIVWRAASAAASSSSWDTCPPVVMPALDGVWASLVTIESRGYHVAEGVMIRASAAIGAVVLTSLSALHGEQHGDVHFADGTTVPFDVIDRSLPDDAALLRPAVTTDRPGLPPRVKPRGIVSGERLRLLVQERGDSPGTMLALEYVQVTTVEVRDLAGKPVIALEVMSRLPLVPGAVLLSEDDEVVAFIGMASAPGETMDIRRYVAFPVWFIRSAEHEAN